MSDEKIIQIISAPNNMYAQVQSYDDFNDEYLTDDWGQPIYDDHAVVCLALMENAEGKRSVVPMINDDDENLITRGIELATDFERYAGCITADANDCESKVTIQDNGGTIYIHEHTTRKMFEETSGKYSIAFLIENTFVFAGTYNSKAAAKYVLDEIAGECDSCGGSYSMPSAESVDEWIKSDEERKEEREAKMRFRKIFSGYQASKLAAKGYRHLDEIECATDDDLAFIGFSKQSIESIRKKLEKEDSK